MASCVVSGASRRSLWWRYKHLAPVPITLVAGVVLTTIMTPYFKDPLIANLIRQHFNVSRP